MMANQAKMDTYQAKADAIHKKMMAKIDDNQKRMEADRKTDREEMKVAIQSIWSELDETQVENIMTRINHETQSLQKA
jgi:hypothetical protein